MHLWRRDRFEQAGSDELSDDVESYLRGSYLEDGRPLPFPTPAWCWLNRLAHGELSDLKALCRQGEFGRQKGTEAPWRMARQLLALEILLVCEGKEPALRRLQQEVLIPLESKLIDDRSNGPGSPAEFLFEIRSLLEASRP